MSVSDKSVFLVTYSEFENVGAEIINFLGASYTNFPSLIAPCPEPVNENDVFISRRLFIRSDDIL